MDIRVRYTDGDKDGQTESPKFTIIPRNSDWLLIDGKLFQVESRFIDNEEFILRVKSHKGVTDAHSQKLSDAARNRMGERA